MRAAILTVSDACAHGEREDASGQKLHDLLQAEGWEISAQEIVPDDFLTIVRRLVRFADEDRVALVVTTGGTGAGPRDVTPEATRMVIERPFPGIAEALRRHSETKTKYAIISRGEAGSRGHTLIVNFPGSPKSIVDCWEILAPVAGHACRLLAGQNDPHL